MKISYSNTISYSWGSSRQYSTAHVIEKVRLNITDFYQLSLDCSILFTIARNRSYLWKRNFSSSKSKFGEK